MGQLNNVSVHRILFRQHCTSSLLHGKVLYCSRVFEKSNKKRPKVSKQIEKRISEISYKSIFVFFISNYSFALAPITMTIATYKIPILFSNFIVSGFSNSNYSFTLAPNSNHDDIYRNWQLFWR